MYAAQSGNQVFVTLSRPLSSQQATHLTSHCTHVAAVVPYSHSCRPCEVCESCGRSLPTRFSRDRYRKDVRSGRWARSLRSETRNVAGRLDYEFAGCMLERAGDQLRANTLAHARHCGHVDVRTHCLRGIAGRNEWTGVLWKATTS